jgi:hypothetical protein
MRHGVLLEMDAADNEQSARTKRASETQFVHVISSSLGACDHIHYGLS